jgi:hypothetical protein
VSVNTWLELDLTSAITGNGTFSFALSGGSNNVVDYSSSEGANPPQLVVVFAGSAKQLSLDSPQIEAAPAPGGIALHANRPNPFVGGTSILYALPQPMPVRLAIYDITGREVRTLVNSIQGAGESRVTWDGKDQHGSSVSAGVYIYRLEAAGTTLTRRLSVLK